MYLGIDIGTSALKAVIIDGDGQIVAQSHSTLVTNSPETAWSEQNPDDWWNAVLQVCSQLAHSTPQVFQQIMAIGLSGQMHGAVFLDDKLNVIRPAILWNDGRSTDECRQMAHAFPGLGNLAGISAMPGFTAPKIAWLKHSEPENYQRIRHILLPKDYVRLKLTGVLATDVSDAAGTLWLDQKNRRWSQKLCDISATDMSWLPDLFEGAQVTGQVMKSVAAELGLSGKVEVAAGGGDAPAGAVGIGAINNGDSFISLGTSGQLFVVTETFQPYPDRAVHAFAHCVENRWYQMAAMLNGASPLQWLAGVMKEDISVLLEEAAQMSDDRNLDFLPYLSGERTPHNDPEIRGSWYGLSSNTNRAEMTRSIVQGIACSFCDAVDVIAAAGGKISKPLAIGGGARSDFLLQTISDATALTIRRSKDTQAGPALGAARLAMVASGSATMSDIVITPPIDRIFTPDENKRSFHLEKLDRFRALYKALQPLKTTSGNK